MLVLNVDLVKVRGAGSHYFTVEPHLVPVSGVVTIFYIKHLFIYLLTYLLTYFHKLARQFCQVVQSATQQYMFHRNITRG